MGSCLTQKKPTFVSKKNFTYLWDQEIKGGNSFAVVVVSHVERFNRAGIVIDKSRFPAVVYLSNPPLMFSRQICTKADFRELPLAWILGNLHFSSVKER